MVSDLFLVWMAGVVCCVASIDRPDRYMFWVYCTWFTVGVNAAHFMIGAPS